MKKKIQMVFLLFLVTAFFMGCEREQTQGEVQNLGNFKSTIKDLDVKISDYTSFFDSGKYTIYTRSDTIGKDINEEIYFTVTNNGEKFAENVKIGLTGDVKADENIIIDPNTYKTLESQLRIGNDYSREEYFVIKQINTKFSRNINLGYYYLYDYKTDLNTIICLESPYIRTELQKCNPRGDLELEYSSGPLGIVSVNQDAVRQDNKFKYTYRITLDNSVGGKFGIDKDDDNDFKTDITTGRFENEIKMKINKPLSQASLTCKNGRRTTVESLGNDEYSIKFFNTELNPTIECELVISENLATGKNFLTTSFSYIFYNEKSIVVRNEYEDLEMI